MYYVYYNTINLAALSQLNAQSANNVALFSLGTTQVAAQGAANNGAIIQG